jgi:hypothetical protein
MSESTKAIFYLLIIALSIGGMITLLVWATEEDNQAQREHTLKVLTEHYEKVKNEKIKRAVSRGFAHYDRMSGNVVWDNEDVYFVVFGDEEK